MQIPSISEDHKFCHDILNLVSTKIPSSQLNQNNGSLIWGHKDLHSSKWLINTHLDVVPANQDQFNLKVMKDKAWGRGAADVKGCAAILIDQNAKWEELAKKKKITFLLVTDEEIGGKTTRELLPKMKQLKGVIFLEPTNLHIVIEAKGMMQIKIVAGGKSVHGSMPWEGINAIEKITSGLAKFRLDHPQSPSETKNTTFNFSQINGGTAINQVPDHAELWCDVRTDILEDQSKIVHILESSFSNCTVTPIIIESPIICSRKSRIFESLSSSFKANSINPLTQFSHLTSDARHGTNLNIPSVVFGPKGGNLHGDLEWVSIKSLGKVEKILDHWIKNI